MYLVGEVNVSVLELVETGLHSGLSRYTCGARLKAEYGLNVTLLLEGSQGTPTRLSSE